MPINNITLRCFCNSCRPTAPCPQKIQAHERLEIWAASNASNVDGEFIWSACLDNRTLPTANRSIFDDEGCMAVEGVPVKQNGDGHTILIFSKLINTNEACSNVYILAYN